MEQIITEQPPVHRELTEADNARVAKEHGRTIYRTILKRVRNPSDAEDIFQNSLCIALRARGTFMWQSSPETWMCGIALNLVRNFFSRAAQHRYNFETDELLDLIPDEDHNPADIISRNETTDLIGKHIAALPDDMRKTLLLITEENHTYEEVATVMGVPIGTVRSRIFRARSYLKKFGSHEMLLN